MTILLPLQPLKKILIVEDEKPMARALQLKLEHEGFLVDLAGNGAEALVCVEKEKYSLILTDLVMPDVDGFMFLESLKKRQSAIPVIVLSNLSQQEDEIRAKELGAADYFTKSNTSLASIVEHVKKLLEK